MTGEGSAPARALEELSIDDLDPATRTGWSVVVHGKAQEVTDPAELERLRALPLRPWAHGHRDHYVRILASAITGRRIG